MAFYVKCVMKGSRKNKTNYSDLIFGFRQLFKYKANRILTLGNVLKFPAKIIKVVKVSEKRGLRVSTN